MHISQSRLDELDARFLHAPWDADNKRQHQEQVVVELAGLKIDVKLLGGDESAVSAVGTEGGTEWRIQIRVEDQGHGNREADVLKAAHCQSGPTRTCIEELTSSVAARRRLSYHAHRA